MAARTGTYVLQQRALSLRGLLRRQLQRQQVRGGRVGLLNVRLVLRLLRTLKGQVHRQLLQQPVFNRRHRHWLHQRLHELGFWLRPRLLAAQRLGYFRVVVLVLVILKVKCRMRGS